MAEDGYLAPADPVSAEIRDRGSRFLAHLEPVRSTADALASIDACRRRYANATHVCWAHRVGWPPTERSSDDGEPHGTAGEPILRAIRAAALSDVAVAVVRWFGGVKLGKGGLARAYGGVAAEVVRLAAVEERFPVVGVQFRVPYDRLGAVRRLVQPPEIAIAGERFTECVEVALRVRAARRREVLAALSAIGVDDVTIDGADPDPEID